MADTIKHISKVEIKGLWGKFNFEWNLLPDVNVLSGINGSGKSTILNLVSTLVRNNGLLNNTNQVDEIGNYVSSCEISYGSENFFLCEFIKRNDENRKEKIAKNFNENDIDRYNRVYTVIYGTDYYVNIKESINSFKASEFFQIDLINTFDDEFKPKEVIDKISDVNVRTELDWEIYNLQKKYLDYQINIGKRAFEAISKNNSNGDVIKVKETQEKFLGLVDSLFLSTGKKINRTENEITFLSGNEKLTAYQLSSGEKQLLIILLTVLVQDNKNAILFMDEPEISLHFDWQKDLIAHIRELNPNVQVILATHSPAIIMDGWMDKVSDVSDLIKPA